MAVSMLLQRDGHDVIVNDGAAQCRRREKFGNLTLLCLISAMPHLSDYTSHAGSVPPPGVIAMRLIAATGSGPG